jgi:lipoprotein-anchoring transpeptidase ErfK/SrfK
MVFIILASILGLAILATILLPVFIVSSLFAFYQVTDRIYPGVTVGRSNLQGLTLDEATIELHKAWNIEQRILASDGLQSWELTPGDLGIRLNSPETALTAYHVGRGYSLLGEIGQVVYSLRNGWQVEPVVELDSHQAQAMIEALNLQATRLPTEATLKIEGSQITTLPGELGYAININETMQTLQSDPGEVLLSGMLHIKLMPLPPATADASANLIEIQRILDTPFNLRAYDPITDEYFEWPVHRDALASWLTLQAGDHGTGIAIDQNQLSAYLSALSQNLGNGRFIDAARYGPEIAQSITTGQPATILVSHAPSRYTIQRGDTLLKIGWRTGIPFWMIARANPDINPDNLSVGNELVIPSRDELIPLPIVMDKRIVIDIGQQRLRVYEKGKLIAKHPISTGIDRSPTQPGVFQVQNHIRKAYASIWDLTMPNFLGIYEAWPGFFNGIHGLPTLSNGKQLWGNILGRPASYGCIILDLKAAEELYQWAEDGVIVEIKP